MLIHDEADALLRAATFRIHLGKHLHDGVLTDFFGTGFFIAAKRDASVPAAPVVLALSALHNFNDCLPGQVFDADNYLATGIRRTTPVGVFPAGASPYGCLDMSGTVWEWTRSL